MSNDFTARTQSTEGGCSRAPSLLGEQRSPTPDLAGSRQRLTDRITEILTTHQDVDLGVEGERSWLAAFLAAAAAREALKPVWEVIERYENLLNPWDDVGFEILNALRPLVYPSEELKR